MMVAPSWPMIPSELRRGRNTARGLESSAGQIDRCTCQLDHTAPPRTSSARSPRTHLLVWVSMRGSSAQ
eukprot:8437429-Alexandrium_andersonii.AAC.1